MNKTTLLSLLPVFSSLLAVIIAALTYYSTQMRPAKIKIHAAERIALWHENGILGFDIPMTFFNIGKKPGVIHTIGIVFFSENKKEDIFLLKWRWFLKLNKETKGWEQEGMVFPIALELGATITKCINFISFKDETCKTNWVPSEGDYTIKICAWSKKRSKPNIKDKFNFHIDAAKAKKIQDNLTSNKRVCNYIFRTDFGIPESKMLTKHELDKLV